MTIDHPGFDDLVQSAVDEAIETHRRMGRPIVVWQDGRVRWIAPQEIEPIELPADKEAREVLLQQEQREADEADRQSSIEDRQSL